MINFDFKKISSRENITALGVSLVPVLFGIMTLRSGGFALFGGEAGKAFAKNYVPFVLWFNFIAGFFYIITGAGLLFKQKWAVTAALLIVLSTLITFIALGIHIASGGIYETRTVGAMGVRSFTWIFIYIMSRYLMFKKSDS